MEYKDICVFLEMTKTRSFTKTAKALFLSQSTVSTRLKVLEEELGCKLFHRFQGHREITITQEGREFIPVAQRWKQLFEETAMIKKHSAELLRVAVVESVYYEMLLSFAQEFMERHPECILSLKIKDSDEIYQLVHDGLTDYGFAAYVSNIHDISSEELYQQEWRVLSFQPLPKSINVDQLKADKYLAFSGSDFSSLDSWKSSMLTGHIIPRMEINSLASAIPYMKQFGYWCIGTKGYGEKLKELMNINIGELEPQAPSRKIYLLEKKLDNEKPIKKLFKAELREYLHRQVVKEEK